MSRVTPLLCPLLVGRDELLDLADRRLSDAVGSRGQLLLIAGEAGIGKSRFLGAVNQKARARGVEPLYGELAPQDLAVPGASILDLARAMVRSAAFRECGRDVQDLLRGADGDEPRSRRILVVDVVDRISGSLVAPTLLGFEDLQWADQLSLEIIAELARHTRELPVLLVGAYRTDETLTVTLREWRARHLTQRLAEEARLAPLTRDQTALMTTLILDNGLPAPKDVVDAVFERTDGIPLHVEELLGALSDEARADGRAIRESTVPATIEDAVLARFERLSADAQAVAQAGAVLGRCFVPGVLAGIMDLPESALDGPLAELVGQAFLDPPGPRDLYDFRHQLLREALYRRTPPSARRLLHARAAEFGARLEGASEIHASAHFERAGMREEAFRTAASGAESAALLSAHGERYELYRRAIDHMPAHLPNDARGRLLEAFAREAMAIEAHESAEEAARRARDLYVEAGLPVAAARAIAAIAGLARREARPIEVRASLIQAGLALIADVPASLERDRALADLLSERASMELDAMQLDVARVTIAAAGEAATRRVDRELGTYLETLRARIDVIEGGVQTGLVRLARAAQSARTAGFEDVSVTAYRDTVTAAVRVMDYGVARKSLREGMLFADAIEQSHCRHVMGAAAALVDWAAGDWDRAVAGGGQELAEHGCTRGAIGAGVALGYVAMGRGETASARSLLEDALATGERSGAVDLILPAMWGLAEADLIDDAPAAAIDRCQKARDLAVRTGERALFAPFAVTGVRAYLAAGLPEGAEAWVEAVAAHLGRWAELLAPTVDHARGLAHLAAGSTGLARESLEAAIRGWDERGRAWEATWARVDLAGCHLRSNRFADAAAILAATRDTATALGSAPLLARIHELAQVTHRGRGSLDEPWRPLTSREFEVARLISEGMTNAEIAEALAIAPKTASSHVEHILAKLGVARRAEIAVWVANISRTPRGRPGSSDGVRAPR